MLKRIGAEESGEFKAIASGTLPSGKPVVVNADGTVSVVAETTGTESIGTEVEFESGTTTANTAVYDSTNNKVIISYRDNSNSSYGTAIVGTVSGTSISFGTPTVFTSGTFNNSSSAFDSSAGKVVIAYRDGANSNYGTAIVGTVSGTSISFGSSAVFESSTIEQTAAAYDTNAGKVVIAYRDDTNAYSGTAVVATVSGTSISFGTPVVFNSGSSGDYTVVYNSDAQNIIIAYRKDGDTSGQAVVGTVSGTSISFGSTNEFTTNNLNYVEAAYDTNSSTIVITYQDSIQSSHLYVVVGSPSGNSITFGTPVVVNSASTVYPWIAYHAAAKKVVIAYIDETSSSNHGKFRVGTVSGTSITLATASTFVSASTDLTNIIYDPDTEQMVVNYRDVADSNKGKSTVFSIDYSTPNLTSENYIGMSRGVAFQTGSAQSTGTEVAFDGHINQLGGTFDSNSNKIVFAYQDSDNSSFGTAVVGTISGTSISFGTPVVFHSANQQEIAATFDSTNNKVVIVYRDTDDSNKGKAVVGTVSGTSISFGSEVEFNDNNTRNTMSVVFDSSNDKVVVAYSNNSFYGRAIVGTVSGTSISFGTAVTFDNAGGIDYINATFDSTNNKVVITWRDSSNNNYPTAIVGTVSGTSISYGSKVAVATNGATHIVPVFDPTEGKVVVFYNATPSTSESGRAAVGTVSGTSISFGSSVSYYDNGSTKVANFSNAATYDSNSKKVVLGFQLASSILHGSLVAGKVSGTTITFDDVLTFSPSSNTSEVFPVYDSSSEKVGVAFRDPDNSNAGTGFVFKTDDRAVTRAEVTNGGNTSVDIIGSVSDNQIGLTAGQQYYVQTDGTISTTADSPSVLAGTAISATELLVKT